MTAAPHDGQFNLTATSIPETEGNNVTFGEQMTFTVSIVFPHGMFLLKHFKYLI